MTIRPYSQRLKGNFRALGDYVDDAIGSKSIFDFFRIVATSIVPLIKKSPAFEVFIKQWIAERAAYDKEYQDCELKVPEEVESAFKRIESDLKEEGLVKNVSIKKQLDHIKKIFKTRRSQVVPTYIEEAHDEICQLLYEVLRAGRDDIAKKYAVIRPASEVVYDDTETGGRKTEKVFSLGGILFSSNYYHLKELQGKWYESNEAWVSWDKLALLEHAWTTPASFFEKHCPKNPSYEAFIRKDHTNYASYKAANTSNRVMGFGIHCYEVNMIKKKEYEKVVFYKREIFLKHLELVTNEIILEQETQGGVMEGEPDEHLESEAEKLRTIGLRLDSLNIVIKIEWDGNRSDEERIVDDFDSKSEPYLFIEKLCKAPIGEHVDSKNVSNASVAKLFSRLKLGPLEQLFFEKVEGSKTHKAYMKSRTIDCSRLDHEERLELAQFIIPLKHSKSHEF